MTDSAEASPEYRAARRVLLDALDALEPHRDALILVGAQAVYFHAPLGDPRPSYTTDGDLAVDPDLLADRPDLATELEAAGFALGETRNPGHWVSPDGIAIDLMVPEGALPESSSRSAPLDGHHRRTARRTRGLEVALHDNSWETIAALDPDDPRSVRLRIAGPGALLIAKLVKISERLAGNRPDRVLPKDAGDVLRLLRNTDVRALGRRLRGLAADHPDIAEQIEDTLNWLDGQVAARRSELVDLAVRELSGVEAGTQVDQAFRTLAARVVDGYRTGL